MFNYIVLQHEQKNYPKPIFQIVWFLFLLGWMQGMAFLNVLWGLLFITCLFYLPAIIGRINKFKVFFYALLVYEFVRFITTIFAQFPREASVGLLDDFRAITIGFAVLLFVRDEKTLVRSAWVSFIGFTILSWWALIWQLIHFGFDTSGDIIFGVFGHLNYAALYSMTVMLIMMLVLIHVRIKKSWPMLIGIVPIVLMQGPLSSRAVIGAGCVAILVYFLYKPNIKSLIISSSIALALLASFSYSERGYLFFAQQVQHVSLVSNAFAESNDGEADKKTVMFEDISLQIRWEIWGLLFQVMKNHPFGIGPRNHGYIDLTPYKEWMAEHMEITSKNIMPSGLVSVNRLIEMPITYDPHSLYVEVLVDTGLLGLCSLLILWCVSLLKTRRRGCDQDWYGDAVLLMIWLYLVVGLMVSLFHQAGMIIFLMIVVGLLSSNKMAE